MLDEGRTRIFDRGRGDWDGIWRTVIYAVPEESRGERDRVRRTLAWHGFGPLAAATWISPHPRLETVRSALAGLSATRMDLLESRALSRAADREMAFRCWDLDGLGRDYVELISGYEQYTISGAVAQRAGHLLYGIGTPMTLQQQDFQGTKDAYIFNVKTLRYEKVDSMNYARWYPTLAEMGDGMDMAISGLNGEGQISMNSEMFNPATKTWSQGPVHGFPTYPSTFLTANGELFFTGSNSGYGPATQAWRSPGFWNVKTDTFTPVPGIPDAQDLETSASVLLPPAQNQTVMVMGGGGVGQSNSATARTALLDMSAPDKRSFMKELAQSADDKSL